MIHVYKPLCPCKHALESFAYISVARCDEGRICPLTHRSSVSICPIWLWTWYVSCSYWAVTNSIILFLWIEPRQLRNVGSISRGDVAALLVSAMSEPNCVNAEIMAGQALSVVHLKQDFIMRKLQLPLSWVLCRWTCWGVCRGGWGHCDHKHFAGGLCHDKGLSHILGHKLKERKRNPCSELRDPVDTVGTKAATSVEIHEYSDVQRCSFISRWTPLQPLTPLPRLIVQLRWNGAGAAFGLVRDFLDKISCQEDVKSAFEAFM